MKNLGLFLAVVLLTITSVAQSTSKYNEGILERSKVYTEVAAEEFDLTIEQQEELYEKKAQHYAETYKARQKFKKGEITKSERKIPNQKFKRYFRKLTGKKNKELKLFKKKVKKELDKL
jgi:hypothetical protein